MWVYEQRTGRLFADSGVLVGRGYAGTGAGRNNPDLQTEIDVGPLPCGDYHVGPAYDHPRLGPVTMNLTPDPANAMFGRKDFRMHGNNPENDASLGCIVQDRPVRERVNTSTDKWLRVVADHVPVAPPAST